MLFAVVITYNPDMNLLNKEYESIINQVDRIIYVDNCSKNKNELLQWMEKKQKIQYVFLPSNEGIGVAQNIGIKKSIECGALYVILFDQDTVIDHNFVKELLKSEKKAISNGLNVAITGPIYVSHDNEYLYPIVTIENEKIRKYNVDSLKNDYLKVSHIIASGMLIRCEVLKNFGLMNENWFIGYIDFEFCFRVTRFGYDIIVTKNAKMKHQMGDSQIKIFGRKVGLYSPFRRYFDCRNTILIQKETVFPKVFRRYYLKLIIIRQKFS